MINYKTAGRAVLFASLIGGLIAPAMAQSAQSGHEHDSAFYRNRNDSVIDRERPQFQSEGIQRGAWIWKPVLRLGVLSDDNIYASATNTQSDLIYSINPSLEVETTWSVHGFEAYVSGHQLEYSDFSDESLWTSALGAAGHIDFAPRTRFDIGADFANLSEPRWSSGFASMTVDPIEFETSSYKAKISQEFSRTRIEFGAELNSYDYDDGVFILGGVADQDFRDRDETIFSLRGDFALNPDRSIFVRVRSNDRQYDLQPPAVAATRDSSGYMIDVGADFDIDGVARGIIGVGYNEQDYDNPAFGKLEGFGVDGVLEWYLTRLTTVTFAGSRYIEDSPIVNTGGLTATSLSVSIDHELRRNVILSASIERQSDDYLGIDREDERWSTSASATYLMNRHVGIRGEIRRTDQESTGLAAGRDFEINTIGLRLILRP